MWVHFIIFMTAFGTVLVWKAGWLRLDGIADKESLRLFLIVAVCGNLAGMAMTLTNGNSEIYQKGHRIEKSEDGAYTEEWEAGESCCSDSGKRDRRNGSGKCTSEAVAGRNETERAERSD